MDVELHWFNGYYNKNFKNKIEAKEFFENNLDSRIYQCHPLVNSKWCKLHYNIDNPLDLEFSQNDHEWSYLHPLFDPFWYQTQYMNFDELESINPYEHFLLIGHKINNSTHQLVDTNLLLQQFPNTGYLDVLTHLGQEIMDDSYRSLRKIKFGATPILNSNIDWNYLYPALAWKWI
jgi:hypothetical protein